MKMRIFNIVVSFAIVALNIYVSFTHTLTLFRDGGFAQEGLFSFLRIDLAAVIAAELVFFMGCVNIINAHIQHRPAGYPAYLTSGLGVILIGWSNVYAQWEYGFMGFVLGLSVPIGIVLSELMFSHSVSSYQRNQEDDTKSHETNLNKIEDTQKKNVEKNVDTIANEGSHKISQKSESENENALTTHKINNVLTQKKKEPQPAHISKKDTQKITSQIENVTKNAEQVAWELFEKSDRRKLPKIKDIEEIAGVSQWDARKARDKLKKELKAS
jgi:predicted nucleic acid-binding protein